jgi:hypothetical protein
MGTTRRSSGLLIRELPRLEDELLGVVDEAESKVPTFTDGGEAIKRFIVGRWRRT